MLLARLVRNGVLRRAVRASPLSQRVSTSATAPSAPPPPAVTLRPQPRPWTAFYTAGIAVGMSRWISALNAGEPPGPDTEIAQRFYASGSIYCPQLELARRPRLRADSLALLSKFANCSPILSVDADQRSSKFPLPIERSVRLLLDNMDSRMEVDPADALPLEGIADALKRLNSIVVAVVRDVLSAQSCRKLIAATDLSLRALLYRRTAADNWSTLRANIDMINSSRVSTKLSFMLWGPRGTTLAAMLLRIDSTIAGRLASKHISRPINPSLLDVARARLLAFNAQKVGDPVILGDSEWAITVGSHVVRACSLLGLRPPRINAFTTCGVNVDLLWEDSKVVCELDGPVHFVEMPLADQVAAVDAAVKRVAAGGRPDRYSKFWSSMTPELVLEHTRACAAVGLPYHYAGKRSFDAFLLPAARSKEKGGGPSLVLNQRTVVRNEALRRAGYAVATIRYDEWNAMRDSRGYAGRLSFSVSPVHELVARNVLPLLMPGGQAAAPVTSPLQQQQQAGGTAVDKGAEGGGAARAAAVAAVAQGGRHYV